MEKRSEQQSRSESKTRSVEQINICLRSGNYSRALDLLRGTAAEFPDDAELSELEKLARDGIQRNADVQRLITESQELFAQQKPNEAIRLLREAYELDKNNSLARAILANALVEHAHSVVETDWLEAETLTNQALKLNPAHPTAKTIRNLIVEQKKASSVEDWVARARQLQSSGDLFAAMAWVAEGLAVHPDNSKLLQIHDAIQRDQAARRRQARRSDVEDLRRIELKIDEAADAPAKQALAERIQTVAAKHWTDGEILAIANRLLSRLGFVPKEGSAASPHSKGAPVIFHVPRPSAPEASRAESSEVPPSPATASPVPESSVPPQNVPPGTAPPSKVPPSEVRARNVPPSIAPVRLAVTTPAQAAAVPAVEPSASEAKLASASSQPKESTKSNSTALILVSAAAIILVAATFFFTRKHYASPAAQTSATSPAVSAPAVSTPVSVPGVSAPAVSAPATTIPKPSLPPVAISSDTSAGKIASDDRPSNGQPGNGQPGKDQPGKDQPAAESGHNLGALLVVAGQDDANVFLNGKLQRQLTQGGQLRLPNLELKDYVVQVSKSGFKDPPQQKIRIRKGEQATLTFHFQPQTLQSQPRLASLSIQGGAPGTTVLVDQAPVGTIQPDGALSVSTINPGDHTVELRHERFKSRQFQKHFVAGETISFAGADAALDAAPGELKITFTPPDAKVAIAKGELLKMVSSGVPLNLAPGSYTLTARTAERFTRSSTLEVIAGQSKTLDLALAPSGMSKWDNAGAWRQEKGSFIRKGGDFVLYEVAPASGTFVFSAMLTKGHSLQWVLNYSDPKNYILFQMDENNFYRTVIRNGQKTDQIIVPDKGDKKSFRTLQIRVSSTELVHQIKHGDSWTILDRWTQPGANLGLGKFGFYIPGNDEVALSSFAHYAELNTR